MGCGPAYQMALRASYPDQGSTLGREDLLEEGKATQSSILSWRIPQTEEAGGLQSRGSQRDTTEQLSIHTPPDLGEATRTAVEGSQLEGRVTCRNLGHHEGAQSGLGVATASLPLPAENLEDLRESLSHRLRKPTAYQEPWRFPSPLVA